MKRSWRKGFSAKLPADVVSIELRGIKERRGRLVAPFVVEEASKKSSPLHSLFEWDNTRAAHLYRLQQARVLIQHVGMKLRQPDGTELSVPEFYSVLNDGEKIEGAREVYVTLTDIRRDERLATEVVESARRELLNWKTRYETITAVVSALRGIFKAIEKAL
jgi:hypothetical protein